MEPFQKEQQSREELLLRHFVPAQVARELARSDALAPTTSQSEHQPSTSASSVHSQQVCARLLFRDSGCVDIVGVLLLFQFCRLDL